MPVQALLRRSVASVRGPSSFELLTKLHRIKEAPLEFLAEYTRDYGDLWGFTVGGQEVVFVNHPDVVRRVLLDNARSYSKDTFQYRQLARITGDGLLTSDGEVWFSHRRLLQNAFHPKHYAELVSIASEEAHALSLHLHSADPRKSGVIVDIHSRMLRLAMRILERMFFSEDSSGEVSQLVEDTEAALDYIVQSALQIPPLSLWTQLRGSRGFKHRLRRIDCFVHCLMRQHQKGNARGATKLLDLLMAALEGRAEPAMSEHQVRDEIVTLIIAGHETVATALSWTLYLVAQHSDIQEAMRAELSQVLGAAPSLTLEELPRLKLTRSVVEEALRLFPPAWLITRRAIREDVLGGHIIPAGTLVVISPYILHRHAAFWREPERFDPMRFDPLHAKTPPRFAYLPFGAGPRLCIGHQFAMLESVAVLATLVRHLRFSLVPGYPRPRMQARVTLQPHGGLWLQVQPAQ
ncbi:MAG: cytochrome P450 [Thermoflexales bacterium]|nr:cytochrome P450 [Thermoflexales bacterium]MCS7323795.1 cytochrome P450 [Thermoflexales bacterium]MDW8053903.1 cytochrome P450 [Anaerolineae bacterium]MDW8292445.1 cytochrome P450 [Anaerolineae bacterium]